MSLLFEVWWPTKEPFVWDSVALAKQLTAKGVTKDELEEHKEAASTFFFMMPDGGWAPSPEYFSMVNGNPGSQN
jgi:hypothetical protein